MTDYNKLHLHIDNYTPLGEVFEATEERVQKVLRGYPRLAGKVEVTIAYDGDRFAEHIATAHALFAWDAHERPLIRSSAPNLRFIHAHGAGVSHLMPLDWLPRSVILTNSRGVHGQRAMEYVCMAVLMLNNRVPEMVTSQREGQWIQRFNDDVVGKTLLVLGVGHVGRSVAGWAKSLGMHVIGIRRSAKPRRHVEEMYPPEALHSILPRVDFVLVTVPLTDSTYHLIGEDELNLLKPGAGIINYSRARIVDYDALLKKLERREMSAILDVFDPEPLPKDSPLWHAPNLIITTHSSSDDTHLYTTKTLDVVFANLERLMDGQPLINKVSRRRQY